MTGSASTDRPTYTILLVEDEAGMRDVMRSILTMSGHEVVDAIGGKEAKWHLERRAFDVVITDLWMPNGSGLDLVAHIRRQYGSMSVIAVTGRPATLIPPELLTGEQRVDAVLEKPFPLLNLVDAVGTAGERARLIARLASAAAS